MLTVYLILVGLGLILILNVISFFVHSSQYLNDKKFHSWLKKDYFVIFWIFNIMALLTNFKCRQVIFTKVFNLGAFRAELISVEKFKVSNLMSFLGIIAEILLIYAVSR